MHYKRYTSPSRKPQEGQALLRAAVPPRSHPAYVHQGPDFGSCVALGPSPPFPTMAHRLQWGHHHSWAGGRWGGRRAGQLPEPGLARLGAQAALFVRGTNQLCSRAATLESKPEELNLELTQMAAVVMQPLRPQASTARHVWVWLGPAGRAGFAWAVSEQ